MDFRRITFLASLLVAFSVSGTAWAEHAQQTIPSKMTPEEYSAYRDRISQQIEKKAAQKKSKPQKANNEEATETWREPRKGYGQGYRARQERQGAASRNDAANRMGGRSR